MGECRGYHVEALACDPDVFLDCIMSTTFSSGQVQDSCIAELEGHRRRNRLQLSFGLCFPWETIASDSNENKLVFSPLVYSKWRIKTIHRRFCRWW